MESEAQWKEVQEFSEQIHTIAQNALIKRYEDAEKLKPHLKSTDLFLGVFKTLLKNKNEKTHAKKKSATLAMQRVKYTGDFLVNMRKDIEKDKENLKHLAEEAKKYGENIKEEQNEIVAVNQKLAEEEAEENEATQASRKLKEECEAELAAVMPEIEKALASLDLIKTADIAVIKAMTNPPAVVKRVVAAVCVMLEIPPEPRKKKTDELLDLYWVPAKKLLGDVNLLRRLRDYDKDSIPDKVMETLRAEFYSHPDFEPVRVARASSAAESLCRWIIAMEKYDNVSREILRPKREKLLKAQEQLGQTLEDMKKNQKKLNVVEENVAALESKLNETEEKKKTFEEQIEQKDKALGRAGDLVGGLKDECNRWNVIIEDFRKCYITMVGDSILSAGAITYLGPLTKEERDEAITSWINLINTSKEKTKSSEASEFSLHKFINDPITLENWRVADFPQDPLWLDNVTIVFNSGRIWPVAVDPLGVVNKLIKHIEKDIVISKPGEESFIDNLKECVINGKSFLLEDVTESMDGLQITELLTKSAKEPKYPETVKIGEGDEEIKVHHAFRLYITTRTRCLNPFFYLTPDEEKELESCYSVVNFVPPDPESIALQHALLSGIVAKEKKKLEAERLALIAQTSQHRCKSIEISNKVLNVLSNPQGGRIISIDMTLAVLEARKPMEDLEKKMKEDEEAMQKIDSSLDSFRKLAIKLAKKFCSQEGVENQAFNLEAFIKKAL